jgi:Holliday junction resolvase RusA-like endonuclease
MTNDAYGLVGNDNMATSISLAALEQREATRVSFRVPGTPAPKGSRIPGRRKDGSIFTRPASKGEKPWTEAVALIARGHRPPGGKPLEPPYKVELSFVMPMPKRPSHEWPSTGDIDKYVRSTFDGLVIGGLILDDRHIVDLCTSKRFGDPSTIGVQITIA